MNADEILEQLRDPENCDVLDYIDDAADLIESLQGRLAEKASEILRLKMEKELMGQEFDASQARERAAAEDMKLIVDAVREEHCDETCCFACKFDCDTSITDSGAHACECPGFERDDCFEWRGPQGGKGEAK